MVLAIVAVLGTMAALVVAQTPALRERVRMEVEAMAPSPVKRVAAAVLAWFAVSGTAVSAVPTGPLPPPPPMRIGINPPAIGYGGGSAVPFANLTMGSSWLDAHWAALAEQYEDKDGNILSLPAGGYAQRFVSIPEVGPAGIEVQCTWAGSGTLGVAGPVQVLASGHGSLRFHAARHRGQPDAPYLILGSVDPSRPFRDLDCRDARLARSVRFRPEFLQTMRGYRVMRFMDWQNANANPAVTWAERHTPAGNRTDRDGVSIEDMLALAREVGADPWFVMPWNADNNYLAHFARAVRDMLPPERHVYVEVGNEVWNDMFAVARQASFEGHSRGMGDGQQGGARRYAQRTGEVMRVWEAAFAGRSGLVRVLSSQNEQPNLAQVALSFGDVAQHVDALATAPYFGTTYPGTGNTRESVLKRMEYGIPYSLGLAQQNRLIAASFGKRYIAYEAGEGLALPDQPSLREALQHDPAQYALVRRYLDAWQHDLGDTLCWLTSVAPAGAGGNWGLQAWEDETPAQAPKLRAVRDTMAPP